MLSAHTLFMLYLDANWQTYKHKYTNKNEYLFALPFSSSSIKSSTQLLVLEPEGCKLKDSFFYNFPVLPDMAENR